MGPRSSEEGALVTKKFWGIFQIDDRNFNLASKHIVHIIFPVVLDKL